MSGTNYLADTNALIYLLDGRECMKLPPAPFILRELPDKYV